MTAARIALGLLALLHVPAWFFLVMSVASMSAYRSAVTGRASDGALAIKAIAVLVVAIFIGCVLANFKFFLHAVTAVVVLALVVIFMNDIKLARIDWIPSAGVACLPISVLWLAFYAWALIG